MKQVAASRERTSKGEDVAPELLNLLKSRLANHIKGEDRDYIESVRKITDSSDQELSGWLNTTLKKLFG